jgi:hypothetical protein
MEPVDLCDVAVEAIDELWPQSAPAQDRIEQVGCEAPLMVLGDRGVLARTLVNLLGNAVKYSPEGSTITVTLAEQPSPAVRHQCRPRSPTRGPASHARRRPPPSGRSSGSSGQGARLRRRWRGPGPGLRAGRRRPPRRRGVVPQRARRRRGVHRPPAPPSRGGIELALDRRPQAATSRSATAAGSPLRTRIDDQATVLPVPASSTARVTVRTGPF